MTNNKRMASGGNSRFEEETHHHPLSDNRNPLLNDVVLTRLFEVCHASDLPRFRLVSKKWHALASDSFRRDVPVTFKSPRSSSRRLRFESFFDLDPEKIPFGNFRMELMNIDQLPEDSSENPIPEGFMTFRQYTGMFWGRYGRCIRKLVLWCPVVHSVEAFKKLILEDTPNLEELSLFDIQDETGGSSGNFDGGNARTQLKLKRLVVNPLCCLPVGWDLLRHFPNIQSVEVTPRYRDTFFIDNGSVARHLTEISEQLSTRRRPCRTTVHKLEFGLRSYAHTRFYKEILQIPQLSFPELHFVLGLSDKDCEVDLLSTAFRHHGENLKYLHVESISLHRHPPNDNLPFTNGPFNSTTSIRLSGNLCENLHFLKHFPNLEILQMDHFDAELLKKTESTTMETFTLQALKDLRLDMGSKHIPKDKMEMLVKVMPRVEKFHGRLINASLRVLCREWKQLKDLIFETSSQSRWQVNDEGITGIICGSDMRLPNITDLKALESFCYKGKDLSDASIWNGFLQMPNLKYLSTVISPDVSDDAFGALTEKFADGDMTLCSHNEGGPWCPQFFLGI